MTETVLTGRRTIAEVSLDARLMFERFDLAKPGETVTYDDLDAAIGRSSRKNRSQIATALRMMLRERGAVFLAVHGVGYRRANAAEVSAAADQTFGRVRRAVRREVARQATVPLDALPPQDRSRHLANLSAMGALAEFSKPSAPKQIANANPSAVLPVGKVLELFK